MSGKISGETRFELDPNNLPTMSDEQMAALRAMTDEDIDLTDIPEMQGPPTRRVHGPRFRRPQDVVAVEPEILEFFKVGGSPAVRINEVLRDYVEAQRTMA